MLVRSGLPVMVTEANGDVMPCMCEMVEAQLLIMFVSAK